MNKEHYPGGNNKTAFTHLPHQWNLCVQWLSQASVSSNQHKHFPHSPLNPGSKVQSVEGNVGSRMSMFTFFVRKVASRIPSDTTSLCIWNKWKTGGLHPNNVTGNSVDREWSYCIVGGTWTHTEWILTRWHPTWKWTFGSRTLTLISQRYILFQIISMPHV